MDFSRLKEVRKAPLIAPPVPMRPAKKPDKLPPRMLFLELFFRWVLGFENEYRTKAIRKMPRRSLRNGCGRCSTKVAPMIVSIMLGMPNRRRSFLLSEVRKNVILPMLPEMCNMATKISAVLKSKKNKAAGKKMVEDPNPAKVPMMTASSAMIQNSSYIYLLKNKMYKKVLGKV